MGKITKRAIVSDHARVDRDCVATLAKAYRRALAGEFQAVAIATVTEGAGGGNFGSVWSQPESRALMAGAVGYLNHRYMQEAVYER